jgi:hypothetical protein
MKRLIKVFLPFGFCAVLTTTPVLAIPFLQTTNIFDEYGHGIIQTNGGSQTLPFTVAPDPTGGLLGSNVLIYSLTYLGIKGDVLIFTGDPNISPLDDVIRFDGGTNLIFYADSLDGFTDLADTLGPPNPLFTNQVSIVMQSFGNGQAAFYTPILGQPGYNASNPNYIFLIDTPVPEPSSTILLLGGLGVVGLVRLRQSSRVRNWLGRNKK